MANKISVLIDVSVDRANTALKNFRTSIGDAEGVLGKFQAGIKSAGDSLKANIAPVAASAGLAVAAFAAKSIAAASDLSESTNAVNVSFGKAAEGVLEIGENSAKSMGLSKSAFNEAAVGFAAFAEGIAGPGGDAADVIGEITGRAADFASVMNMEVSEATDVFRSALSGETEPIKKFGIDLSAAAVQAYALANGLIESGEVMSEATKVQARYGLLMEKTSKFHGDFANTSDGLANSTRIASARIEDFQAKVGTELIPVVASAVNVALDLADALEAVGASGGGASEKLTDNRSIWDSVTNAAENALNPLQLAAQTYGDIRDKIDEASGAGKDNTEVIYGQSQALVQESIDAALAGKATDDWAASQKEATRSAEDATNAINAQREAQEAATDAVLSAIDSSLGFRNQQADTIATITESSMIMADSARTTEEQAQAARDAEGASLDWAAAAVRLAEDQAAANGETLSAEEKARIYRDELQKLSAYLTGPALDAINGHIAALGAIPKSIYTNIGITRSGDFTPMVSGKRAAGGPVSPGGTYLVGEQGPELLQMGSQGGNVIPNGAVVGGGSSSGGDTYVTINVAGLTGPQVANDIVAKIKEYERRNGAGWRS